MRKKAIEDRIKVFEEVKAKIANCRRTLQEKKTRSQQKVNGIKSQGQVDKLAFQSEINHIKEQIQRLEEQRQFKQAAMQDKELETEQEIETEVWHLQSEEQKIELEIQQLQSHPKLKSQSEIDELKQELNRLESEPMPRTTSNARQSNNDDHDCPVCSNRPVECHGCQTCDNWVCQDCKGSLTNCPHCREDLTQKPLRRNRALERVILRGEEL